MRCGKEIDMSVRLSIVFLALLAACTQVPELKDTVTADMSKADFPDLVPLDTALGPAVDPEDEASKLQNELVGRRERLRNRATQLQASVVDDTTRDRLNTGISQ
ncbi:hypothetical protein NBRC116597_05900 [Phaeobacter sp. NW0010-22]